MNSFIMAAEVWQPDFSQQVLSLTSSHYGPLTEFATASRKYEFAFGQGLPGKAWAARRPLLWSDLSRDDFLRTELAQRAGIACGLAMPIYAGDFLLAILVLFFSRGDTATGAVEIWGKPKSGATELRLVDGYYGELNQFEWISRRLSILPGRGLPGTAWSLGKPVIFDELADSNAFLRAKNAAEAGITTGLALPFLGPDDVLSIVTFLSTHRTPVAKRFEIWGVDQDSHVLKFGTGHCMGGTNLIARYRDVRIDRGEGDLGLVWLTGAPLIRPVSGDQRAQGLNGNIFIPMIRNGALSSMVVITY